jgi:hypothetical protein
MLSLAAHIQAKLSQWLAALAGARRANKQAHKHRESQRASVSSPPVNLPSESLDAANSGVCIRATDPPASAPTTSTPDVALAPPALPQHTLTTKTAQKHAVEALCELSTTPPAPHYASDASSAVTYSSRPHGAAPAAAAAADDLAGSSSGSVGGGGGGSTTGMPVPSSDAALTPVQAPVAPCPAAPDRMVHYLSTLVIYPAALLLTQAAAAGVAGLPGGVGGGVIDTRSRLVDFPEGAAIADLERFVVWHP